MQALDQPPVGIRVLVVGAGVNGLATANALSQAESVESVVMIEKQDDIGGIWNQYQYPGLRLHTTTARYGFCDLPSSDPELRSSGASVKDYLQCYWQKCSEHVELHLNTELMAIDERPGYVSCTIRTHNGPLESWAFSHLVLACVHQPRMPVPHPVAGVVHCSQATQSVMDSSHRIVLVGAGKAACDIIMHLTPTHVRVEPDAGKWLLWTAREGSFLWFADRTACVSGEWWQRYMAWQDDDSDQAHR